jgi:hypothetical protein
MGAKELQELSLTMPWRPLLINLSVIFFLLQLEEFQFKRNGFYLFYMFFEEMGIELDK